MIPVILAAIGTANNLKRKAVESVLKRFYPHSKISVVTHVVATNISHQPIGFSEIYQGAFTRAQKIQDFINKQDIWKLELEAHQKFYIGIEAGLVEYSSLSSKYLAHSFCVILDENGQMGTGISPGWEYPLEITQKLTANRDLELADVMGEISGDADIREKEGAVGYFSRGLISRMDLAQWGIKMALIPFLSPEAYKKVQEMDKSKNKNDCGNK
ncbi:MAG: DUF84 family protein [Promethearchaeota archaeon]